MFSTQKIAPGSTQLICGQSAEKSTH